MKTVGIIAEYNPFHNGHLYQMQEARRRSGADYVVVAMSGDFVQRGEPALLDKWVRARMALEAGADLVLELPVRVSTGSAEFFARGGISLLSSLGTVDVLSFGYEGTMPSSGIAAHDVIKSDDVIQSDLKELTQAAAFFSREESEDYKKELKSLLSAGMTYAQARVEAYLKTSDEPVSGDLLKSPNNILAVEYLKAIRQLQSPLSVVPVPRIGAGYNDPTLPEMDTAADTSTNDTQKAQVQRSQAQQDQTPQAPDVDKSLPASASGIRHALSENRSVSLYMPEDAYDLMTGQLSQRRSLASSDLDLLMHESLLRRRDHLEEYLDVSPDLANRIRTLLGEYTDFESFAMQLKTRQVALTRVKRALLHILLGIKKGAAPVTYARVLGFRKTAQPLLHKISQEASVPMITKLPKDIPEGLSEDLYAAHLWEMLVCHKTGRPLLNEYQRQLIIL